MSQTRQTAVFLFCIIALALSASVWVLDQRWFNVADYPFWGDVMMILILPGLLLSLLVFTLAGSLGVPVSYGGILNPTPDGLGFNMSIVMTGALFWTLVLLGLRVFFVRAYEVLK